MNKKKNILVLLSYHLPNISGITVETQRLSEELVKRNFSITILTSCHKKDLPQQEIINGVNIVRLPVLTKLGKQPIQPSYFWQVIKYIRKADAVHLHWPYAESFYVGLLTKILGKPLIITHHVDEPDFSTMKPGVRTIAKKALYVSHLICGTISKYIIPRTKDYALHSDLLQNFKEKLLYCYPLIYDFTPTTKNRLEMEKKFSQYEYKIGFSGRISRQKGIRYLLKSIPIIKKFLGDNFVIAFAGPYKEVIGEHHLGELSQLIKKYQKNLIFLGNLSPNRLFAFYESIDCLVLPSIHRAESFGQVQVEAMLRGTPVVASNLPGARIPVRKTGMGKLIKPKNAEKLAKAIVPILKNPEKYKVKRSKVVNNFNPQKVVSLYSKIFSKV